MFKARFLVFAYRDRRANCRTEAGGMREITKNIYIIEGIGSTNVFLLGTKDGFVLVDT